jgi:hypothetical protein
MMDYTNFHNFRNVHGMVVCLDGVILIKQIYILILGKEQEKDTALDLKNV